MGYPPSDSGGDLELFGSLHEGNDILEEEVMVSSLNVTQDEVMRNPVLVVKDVESGEGAAGRKRKDGRCVQLHLADRP